MMKATSTKEIYDKIYDRTILSDLRIKHDDEEKVIFSVKRSHYLITVPKKVTPDIAYLAGAIAGDGCFYFCRFNSWNHPNRVYPRVRLTVTGSDESYLECLNDLLAKSFGACGHVHRETRKRNCFVLLYNHRIVWLYFRNILKLDKRKLLVPDEVANKDLFRFFLAGFFDTDGYESKGCFGSMIGAKNLLFLQQLVAYSAKFYGLNFREVKVNALIRPERIFYRAYTVLKKSENEKFRTVIPLRNRKYGLARN